jgi:hypothetical protein
LANADEQFNEKTHAEGRTLLRVAKELRTFLADAPTDDRETPVVTSRLRHIGARGQLAHVNERRDVLGRHFGSVMKTTFGQLAIGDRFWWRDTKAIQHGPRGSEPMTKATATRYEWAKGSGTAAPHYPGATPMKEDELKRLRWERSAALSAASFVDRYAKECCRHTEAVSECPHCNLTFLASFARRASAALEPEQSK